MYSYVDVNSSIVILALAESKKEFVMDHQYIFIAIYDYIYIYVTGFAKGQHKHARIEMQGLLSLYNFCDPVNSCLSTLCMQCL